jgi:uncharacterized protein
VTVRADPRFPFFSSTPVSYVNVELKDRFWSPRQGLLHDVTVPWATGHLDRAGGLAALRDDPPSYCPALKPGDYEAIKFVEALAVVTGLRRDDSIERLTDAWGEVLRAGQAEDGYFVFGNPEGADPSRRWASESPDPHESYALGHYLEAGIAYLEATGRQELYLGAKRAVDQMAGALLDEGRPYVSGHPEIEQALTRLYGITGDERYLRLCGRLIALRGRDRGGPGLGIHMQDHLPVEEQRTIEGHAVCAAFLFNGVTEYVGATGEPALKDTVLAVWEDFAERKMYLHGAGGTLSSGFEGYGEPYLIAPADAYCESCSVVGNFRWAHSLARLTGDARYLDVAERMLYNAFYASLSLSGDRFFYQNPIQAYAPAARGRWHWCPCCPPNIVKLFATVSGFFYSVAGDDVFVNHYGGCTARLQNDLVLEQTAGYPWSGDIELVVVSATATPRTVHLRVPGWAESASLSLNGTEVEPTIRNGWAVITRTWRARDRVELRLPMRVRRVTLPASFELYRRLAALERGPLVYCIEQQDTFAPLPALCLPPDAEVVEKHRPDLLGGITVLEAKLPQEIGLLSKTDAAESVRFIPYGVWSNRDADFMTTWLRQT